MKPYLLSLFVSISLVSCSDGESSSTKGGITSLLIQQIQDADYGAVKKRIIFEDATEAAAVDSAELQALANDVNQLRIDEIISRPDYKKTVKGSRTIYFTEQNSLPVKQIILQKRNAILSELWVEQNNKNPLFSSEQHYHIVLDDEGQLRLLEREGYNSTPLIGKRKYRLEYSF